MSLLQQKLPASKYDSKNKVEEHDDDYDEDFEKGEFEGSRKVTTTLFLSLFRSQEKAGQRRSSVTRLKELRESKKDFPQQPH